MADTAALNARIGNRWPRPLPTSSRAGDASPSRVSARVIALLLALLAALWPHWVWMAHRMTDGSDEPWGVLALVTVIALVAREGRMLVMPAHGALLASAALAVAAALLRAWVPPLAAAAVATCALAIFLAAARRDRPTLAVTTLLLLALPIIASLQFYFGYPLRLATAALAAPLLQLLGFAVEPAGAALAFEGRFVLVDPPCAGIGMLWVGAYTAAVLSYLNRASAWRTLLNGAVAAGCVFAANVVRNTALFIPAGLELGWPSWSHGLIGLISFALALVPIVLFVQRGVRRGMPARRTVFVWPQRHHRRLI